jgi:superfamily I DNA and/or RNA helicase/transcription elongation GreA/GreB family factor
MEISKNLIEELQNRLKVGNRRGVHLNAVPGRSRYKFDVTRLKHIEESLPDRFLKELLTKLPLKFKVTWKDNVPDLNSLFEEDQTQLVKITKAFENLINQTNAIESEKGINTFGFGYPIVIRRDQKDKKLTVAPLLIWSLRIKQTKEFNTWNILRNEEDPIYINEVLINHLASDAEIEIKQISSEHLEDGLIDKNELAEICIDVIRSINTKVDPNIENIFDEKISELSPIRDKKYYDKLPITSNNAFIEFGGLFSIFEVQKQNIINDYSNLMDFEGLTIDLDDLENHHFQPISSVQTDPSQQGILNSLQSSRNILIQGPPGTGKSQSLTAILVNALENQKKTIVVCEKQTALDVLHKALTEKGLNYHCTVIKDIVRDRRKVVDSVRERVDNSSYRKYRYLHSKETLQSITDQAIDLIDKINLKHTKLDNNLIGSKNWTSIVGEVVGLLKKIDDEPIDLDSSQFTYSLQELTSLKSVVKEAQNLHKKYKPLKSHTFLNSSKLTGSNPYKIEDDLHKDFNSYEATILSVIGRIAEYKKEYKQKRKEQFAQQKNTIDEISSKCEKIITRNLSNLDFIDETKTQGSVYKLLSLISKTKKLTLQDQIELKSLYQNLHKISVESIDIPELQHKSKIQDQIEQIKSIEKKIELTYLKFEDKISSEFENLELAQENSQTELRTQQSQLIRKEISDLYQLLKTHNWTLNQYSPNNYKSFIVQVKDTIQKKKDYFSHEEDLFLIEFAWVSYFNEKTRTEKNVILSLINSNDWNSCFLVSYLNSLLVKHADSSLPTNDSELNELEDSLEDLEKEQLKFIKEYWYSKQIDSTREFDVSNPNLAVENLFNKRSSKRHRRLSLREIVKLDIELFTTFFPIILTTPDVASNLFKGQNKYFDIVMFDEASQLKLEDNLPALLKGKQVVIAGDEHQMPPSNYFSKVFEGLIDDEDEFDDEDDRIRNELNNTLLDCESLLEFGTQLGFDKMHLDFHYRSRHPFLIDFSNAAFYNQRLKPLPNTFDYTPITYINTKGTYSDTSNDTEAEAVLAILERNISRLPNGEYPSVGVATFNITQRNLILNKINSRKKFIQYKDFNNKMTELGEQGFFVKNLENIQGDERDVIILSTTYGINKEGKFNQRFGSINHQKGYKLLNVIITRAKYKIYIVTSIPEDVSLSYKDYLIAEGSNNRRGALFAYLAYSKAVSEDDNDARLNVLNTLIENSTKNSNLNILNADLESPFEEEVYNYLLDYFPEDRLQIQLQYAGFRIDIVYLPKDNLKPKIAIECDGASYHSSQEAYLHDKHRQSILESNGFVFHRIWSTNWWRSPKREIKKLVDFIQNIESNSSPVSTNHQYPSIAFSDDIEKILGSIPISKVYKSQKAESKTIKAISKAEISQKELFNETITIGCIIKVKYINLNKELKVKLVDSKNTSTKKANGTQEINIMSPLGVALKGKSKGDTVKIGNLDKYVEIIDFKK